MVAKKLDGSLLAEQIKRTLSRKIANSDITPGLAVILVGDDPASHRYVSHKKVACEKVGIRSFSFHLADTVSQSDIQDLIFQLNADTAVHGILLQLPLPNHICSDDLLEAIDPKKDVDGFHPYNLGRLMQRRPLLRPCTPYGIIQLLRFHGVMIEGQQAVIVSASNIVGRPLALEFLLEKATVLVAHRYTDNLKKLVEIADILVVATGHKRSVDSSWVQEGTIVVDVGIHVSEDGKLSGDLDHAIVEKKAEWLTPVPGGVGPMTVASLMQNTVQSAGID